MLSNLAARDVETLIHPYTQLATFRETGPLVLERGEGVWVYDTEGKPYIEGMAGLWCTALGYSNRELVEAAREQMMKLPFTHLFSGRSHDPAIELAEKLKEIAPMPVSKVFFCSSGSEANDTQVKLVWYMNNALGPAAEEEDHRAPARLSRRHRRVGLAHRPAREPHRFRPADRQHPAHLLPALLPLRPGRRERGGVLDAARGGARGADPARRAGHGRGLHRRAGDGRRRRDHAAARAISRRSRRCSTRYDVLFIADEVITGFGRLGTPFGSRAARDPARHPLLRQGR